MNDNCQIVIFTEEAYNSIIVEAFKKNPTETGGIFLGHVLDNGCWVVMEALPPGWRSIFEISYFEYDQEFVNYLAQCEALKYENQPQLLGLWHRHPGSFDTFSSTDDETNSTFSKLHQFGVISGLVNIDPSFRLTLYHVSDPLKYSKVNFEVGDDLIPQEFFAKKFLKRINGDTEVTGLNPSINTELIYAKESSKGTDEMSRTLGPVSTNDIYEFVVKWLKNSKYYLLTFFLAFIIGVISREQYKNKEKSYSIEIEKIENFIGEFEKCTANISKNTELINSSVIKIDSLNIKLDTTINKFRFEQPNKLDLKEQKSLIEGKNSVISDLKEQTSLIKLVISDLKVNQKSQNKSLNKLKQSIEKEKK